MDGQFSMFEKKQKEATQKVVNVASVPQASPFRYPGGKTWLISVVRKWLKQSKSTKTSMNHLLEVELKVLLLHLNV